MNIINEEELEIYIKDRNFEKFENKKAMFNTKIAEDMKHNGEVIDIIGVLKGRDSEHDSYIVKFNDDTLAINIMNIELQFDYVEDPVEENIRKELSKIIKKYGLDNKEIEEFEIAILNYDYEANEGTVFTKVEEIQRLFTDEECRNRINPTINQLKAMAEYIKNTEEYYMLYGYEEYTERVIENILNMDEKSITRIEILKEIKDTIKNNIKNYSVRVSKQGNEKELARENQKLILIEEMIKEEMQKENKSKNKKERESR